MIDFNGLVDNFLKRERKPREIGKYYPSEIATCMRKLWYMYKFPKEEQPDLIKIFEAGNMVHSFIEKVLNSEKNPNIKLLGSELPFKLELDDLTISGRVDNLIMIKENSEQILIEVKSVKSIVPLIEPKFENEMQLQLYMHVLKVHKGILMYVEKNTLKCRTFLIDYNPEISEEAVQRFKILHAHLKTDKMPFPEAKKNSNMNWACQYCDWAEECSRNI